MQQWRRRVNRICASTCKTSTCSTSTNLPFSNASHVAKPNTNKEGKYTLPRGVQPFRISRPQWKKKSCLGPHIKYIVTHNHKTSHNVLSKFTILCWAAFTAILGCLQSSTAKDPIAWERVQIWEQKPSHCTEPIIMAPRERKHSSTQNTFHEEQFCGETRNEQCIPWVCQEWETEAYIIKEFHVSCVI